ncbi:urease accessory protein UreE [Dyadobacter flavalbus]|nr:urease accessory protein UreE [Dyadobacter flavalbus]
MMREPIKITRSLGNGVELGQRIIDFLEVEWYETTKSRIRKKTMGGIDVLVDKADRTTFQNGDLLFVSEEQAIILKIKPCDCIVLRPTNLISVGIICFEIGNKHIPIFMTEQKEVCVAYDANLFVMLDSAGFQPCIQERILFPFQMTKAFGNKSMR